MMGHAGEVLGKPQRLHFKAFAFVGCRFYAGCDHF
jgi:hypothetical protein